ncbi:MAG: hypothetical protein GY856_20765, partial [bacterium]|nr:hypothetical protein [bacterium]
MTKMTIRTRRALSCLAAPTLLLCLFSCSSQTPSILATYAGGEITHEEYAAWLDYKNRKAEPERQQDDLRALAKTEALAEAALTADADREPRVQFTVATMASRQLAAALRKWAAASVEISEKEVETGLEENRDRLVTPPRRRLYNLFKKVPSGASAGERQAIRDQIAAIRRQLVAGADFEAMARRESDSQTRFQGGYMGLAKPGQLPAPIEEAVFRLEPGEISPILEGPEGFTLIKCDAIFAERTMPVDEAREKIRRTLRRRAVKKSWQAMEEELLAAARPEYDLELLRQESADEQAVVARFGDRVLTRREVTWLLAGLPRRPSPDTLSDERLRALLQQHVVTCLAADQARTLGLDEDPELRNRRRWKRLEILAGEELRRLVAAEFVPPQADEIRAYFAANPERFV